MALVNVCRDMILSPITCTSSNLLAPRQKLGKVCRHTLWKTEVRTVVSTYVDIPLTYLVKTCLKVSASEMTYIVSSGALNSTHSTPPQSVAIS